MDDAHDEARAARVWRLTFQFSAEILAEAATEMEALGLEPKEFFVLDGIEARPFPAELARHLSMPKPTVTAYVKSLEAKAFIHREIDAKDLRRHRLALTPAGLAALDRARKILAGRYASRLQRFNSRERAEFEVLLGKLVG